MLDDDEVMRNKFGFADVDEVAVVVVVGVVTICGNLGGARHFLIQMRCFDTKGTISCLCNRLLIALKGPP